MTHNVFVLGLTPMQREELGTVHETGGLEFHDLLDHESLVATEEIDFDALLERARAELDAFDGSVDAIVSHWDFPTSVLGPMLAAERGLPAPSLTSLLKCEHKYWSRLEQRRAVPEVVPGFVAFDPFADDVAQQIDLDFPYWVKPIKGHSSNLGFEIRDDADLQAALEEIRAEITDVGDAFDQVLARVELPEELQGLGGSACLAEEIIRGTQFAPEGSVSRGEYSVHGVFDMLKSESGLSIERIDYPAATVPDHVQQQARDITGRLLEHIGFDDGCFNSEFMWDEEEERLRLIEVNTRISQSHSEMFTLVDGRSNHQVAVDVALGHAPSMPKGEGDLAVAAQYVVVHEGDAIVRGIPDASVLEQLAERYPGTKVDFPVSVGDRLSELPHQDSYRYLLAIVYVGAPDRESLRRRIEDIEETLQFDLEDCGEGRS
ncbi:ATP-grasp domain-containing protein [Janibacter terrae]|uniref:ATP-grasp domain-containing protein n=1 Tax=Janibacter terrae TaxID=103817 RepID=UPI0008345FB3|nr:ATP-grasp domain-containing protein [Janibacter terrae]MBA4084627.1 ATP-grasp domain-containing protein [Kytococcus sp.]